ncbi:MAG TPA: hypothetical protein VE174_13940 [Actinomycetota bacterium]|nr:hypothetical protein [Actinomycetota bacterium]
MNQPVKGLQRPGAALAALFVALPLILAATAQPAHAQLDDVVDTVDETVGGVTDEVEDTVGTATDAVEDVADPDEDPNKGPVQETVDSVTKAVDEVSGGATEPVTDTVRKTTEETLGPIDQEVGGAVDDLFEGQAPGIGSGSTAGSLRNTSVLSRVRDRDGGVLGGQGAAGSVDDPTTVGSPEELLPTQPNIDAERSGSIVEQAGQIAREVAFPLFLLLMVAAFLAIQSRWDKRDPKLALAPLDLDDQYLSFR